MKKLLALVIFLALCWAGSHLPGAIGALCTSFLVVAATTAVLFVLAIVMLIICGVLSATIILGWAWQLLMR